MITFNEVADMARELGCSSAITSLQKALEPIKSENTRVSVVGGINTGKTGLINSLIGSSFPATANPTGKRTRIVFEPGVKDADLAVVKSEWMRGHKLEIIELTDQNFEKEIKPFELVEHFALTDICIFILNGLAPFSKTDLLQLETLDKLKIPVLVLLSKTDQLEEEERQSVIEAIKPKLEKYEKAQFSGIKIDCPVKERAGEVRDFIEKAAKDQLAVNASRDAVKEAYLLNTLQLLVQEIWKKKDVLKNNIAKAENIAEAELEKLAAASGKWLEIKEIIRECEERTKEDVRELSEKRLSAIVRSLNYMVTNASDVKHFLEIQLPYQVENEFSKTMESAKNIINREVSEVSKLASERIRRDLREQINKLDSELASVGELDPVKVSGTEDMTGNKAMRNISKLGTAATVVAAGLVFTLGVPGMVMGASVLAGLVAEFIIDEKQEKAKDKAVNEIIPRCVKESDIALSEMMHKCICETYDSLIKSVDEMQANWKEASRSVIDNKKRKELDNCQRRLEALEGMLQRIEDLQK